MTPSSAANPAPSVPGRPVTHPGRVIAALLLGALCGGGLVSGLMVATAVIQYGLGVGLMLAVVAFPIAVVAWLAGLTVIGGPFWWLLRKAKVTPTRLAAGLGGMLAPLVAAGPQAVVSLGHGGYDGSLIFQVVMFAAFGAIVGWVVARVAYPSERTAR